MIDYRMERVEAAMKALDELVRVVAEYAQEKKAHHLPFGEWRSAILSVLQSYTHEHYAHYSLRAEHARAALTGLLARPEMIVSAEVSDAARNEVALQAWAMADAMLATEEFPKPPAEPAS